MTLREEIAKNRADARNDTWKDMTDDEIDKIIDRIDDLAELLHRIEIKLFNISVNQQPAPQIPTIPEEILNDVVEVFKEVIAERKQELAQKSTKEV